MVSGGMTCVKYLLFFFNLLFVISGVAIIAIGAMVMSSYNKYETFVDERFSAGPIILIVVGVIIFVIAFFGCCGAVVENHCMVVTFSVLLLTIFCIELAAGICGYVYREDVKNGIQEQSEKTMLKYNDSNPDIKNSWDLIQQDLKCCGTNSPNDWVKLGKDIPASCCKVWVTGEEKCNKDYFTEGCAPALKDKVENLALVIGGVAIGIAFVQLVGVIFACCLARSIRKEYETV